VYDKPITKENDMTHAQKKQLAALSANFISMKQLRSEKKGANLSVLRKLKDAGLAVSRDPNEGTGNFVCDEIEWRTA
jgi:hypothetical protein|tara:strand:+ start:1603 stop:1833 length:231 start_codon:yes stop_codon:yes gene_type:complete